VGFSRQQEAKRVAANNLEYLFRKRGIQNSNSNDARRLVVQVKGDALRLACVSVCQSQPLSSFPAVSSRVQSAGRGRAGVWRSGELFRSQKELDPCLRELLQLSVHNGVWGPARLHDTEGT
jgi:hypothetical protein